MNKYEIIMWRVKCTIPFEIQLFQVIQTYRLFIGWRYSSNSGSRWSISNRYIIRALAKWQLLFSWLYFVGEKVSSLKLLILLVKLTSEISVIASVNVLFNGAPLKLFAYQHYHTDYLKINSLMLHYMSQRQYSIFGIRIFFSI